MKTGQMQRNSAPKIFTSQSYFLRKHMKKVLCEMQVTWYSTQLHRGVQAVFTTRLQIAVAQTKQKLVSHSRESTRWWPASHGNYNSITMEKEDFGGQMATAMAVWPSYTNTSAQMEQMPAPWVTNSCTQVKSPRYLDSSALSNESGCDSSGGRTLR